MFVLSYDPDIQDSALGLLLNSPDSILSLHIFLRLPHRHTKFCSDTPWLGTWPTATQIAKLKMGKPTTASQYENHMLPGNMPPPCHLVKKTREGDEVHLTDCSPLLFTEGHMVDGSFNAFALFFSHTAGYPLDVTATTFSMSSFLSAALFLKECS